VASKGVEFCQARPECEACGLWMGCVNPCIPGRGSDRPRVVFVGEAPGRNEDLDGEVFVGMSGELITQALEAFEIPAAQCYFTNVVRCRPPRNKLTRPAARIKACSGLLLEELARLQPDVIVPMGAKAIGALAGGGQVRKMHGRAKELSGFIVLPMYHPAAILRDPTKLPAFEGDFLRLRRVLTYGLAPPAPVDTGWTKTLEEVAEVLHAAAERGYACVDYETNFLRVWDAQPAEKLVGGVGVSLGDRRARFIPLDHAESPFPAGSADRRVVDVMLRAFLESPHVDRVAHNVKYETHVTSAILGYWPGKWRCSMLAHTHVDEEAPHDLKDLAWRMTDLGGYDDEFHTVLPDPKNFLSCSLADLAHYCCLDVIVGELVDEQITAQLTRGQLDVLAMQEQLVPYVARLEQRGKAVDPSKVAGLIVAYKETAADLAATMQAWPEVRRARSILAGVRLAKALEKAREGLQQRQAKARAAKEDGDALVVQRRAERSVLYWQRKVAMLAEPSEKLLDRLEAPFNFRSDPQSRVLLMDPECMGLPETQHYTDSGLPSIGKDALVVWAQTGDSRPREFRRYRRIRHALSQFLLPMPGIIASTVDGFVHAEYLQHVARTKRLASRNPNEQNRIRDDTCAALGVPPITSSMYVSRFPGGELVSGDYSQIELRGLASASGDKGLVTAYAEGRDVHAQTTLGVFPNLIQEAAAHAGVVPVPSNPTFWEALAVVALHPTWKRQRGIGKRTNFLTSYGGSGLRLQAVLAEAGIYLSEAECTRIIDGYYALYPEVRRYMRKVVKLARANNGDVVAMDGCVRHLPALLVGDDGARSHAEREAGNFTIQWPAAKLTTIAIMILEDSLRAAKMESIVVGTIHDSIILDAPAAEASASREILKGAMEAAPQDSRWAPVGWWDQRVPIIADV